MATEPWAEATGHLKTADARLALLIDQVGPCQLQPRSDYLATLAQSIISQQISTKAAANIFGRVSAVMPSPWTIESTQHLTNDFLQSCGVSQQKRNYLLSLIDRIGSGQLKLKQLERLDDEEVIAELTQVKGIGRWTAEMFLIFALNRPDVLPVADLGIREGLKKHFDLSQHPAPSQCHELTAHWRPWRSVAMWYLWRMSEIKPDKS
ncbi:MAG: DNA-3-methyladenine glycosylase family protein [bacterium]